MEVRYHEFIKLRQGTMSIQEYGLKFTQFSMYASHMVDDLKEYMGKFLFGVSDLVKIECRNVMLLGDLYISRIITDAQ